MGEIELYDNLNILPAYQDTDWDRAIAEWEKATKAELVVQLYKGAIVCQIDTVYGHQSRAEFSRATGDSYSSIRDYASVYGRLQRLEIGDQTTILDMLHNSHITYSHVLRAAPIVDNQEFIATLTQAHDDDWSVQRLAMERTQRRVIPEIPEAVQEYAVQGETIDARHSAGGRFRLTDTCVFDYITGEVVVYFEHVESVELLTELVALANERTR